MLDEMERNLYGRDSDVHAAPAGGIPRPNYRAIVIGVVLSLAGLGLILGGVMTHLVLLGVAGFAVVVAGVLLGTRPGKPEEYPTTTRQSKRPSRPSRPSFSERMADKWDQREQ
jgi:hypothetical protein